MIARGLLFALLLSACPQPHELEGRACTADSDCGALVCHRERCVQPGSFATISADLLGASSEGGVELGTTIVRSATRPSLTAFTAASPLPSPRSGAASAGQLLLGGTATAEVLGPGGPTTPLPSERSQLAAVSTGGRLIALGGVSMGGAQVAEVLAAELEPDGGVGAWEPQPALPSGRAGLSAIAAGGFVYALGGEAATGLLDEVLAAPMSGDGALGEWRVAARLPEARARAGSALFDGRLYLAGGTCAGACTPLRAALLADGGLGAFEALPPLSERESPAVLLAGGALHVIGGRRGNGQVLTDVLSLPLGEAAPWQTQLRLPRAVWGAAAWESDGVVHLAGGTGADGGVLADHLTAQTTLAGAEPFVDAPPLPSINEHGRMVAYGGALYAIGGAPRDVTIDAIWRAAALPDAGFGDWTVAAQMPRARGEIGAVAWGGRLYLVAGCERDVAGDCLSISDIYAGDFLGDGGVGNFRVVGQLPIDTAGVAVAVSGGWLYMVGGVTGYNPTRREVLRSRIDPITGGLSPPAATTPLPETPGLYGMSLVASRGFLYVVGGQTGGAFGDYSDRVLAGRLAADGTVTSWSLASRLPEPRGDVNAAIFDDTLYVVMGCNETTANYCGTYPGAMVAAPLLEDGGVGPFATVRNHPSPRRDAALSVLDGTLVTAGGYDGNPQDFVEGSSLHGRGRLGPPRVASAPPAGKVAFVLASGLVYAFGADGSVHAAAPGGAFEPAPSLPSVQTASTLDSSLYAVSGSRFWSAELPLTRWDEQVALPRALVKPVMAGRYVADGTDVFLLRGTEWLRPPALPCPVEAMTSNETLLYAFCGDSGDVLVADLPELALASAWRRAESLPGPRHGFAAAIADGLLYVAGGDATDVLVSSIHRDGSLGQWAIAASLPGPRAPSGLVAGQGLLVAYGADEAIAWPRWTPPSHGRFSLRFDVGRAVSEVESVSLIGLGALEAEARLAGEDGVFGEWLDLGLTRGAISLPIRRPARYVWLRVRVDDDAMVGSVGFELKL